MSKKVLYELSDLNKLLPSENYTIFVIYPSTPRCGFIIKGNYLQNSIHIVNEHPRNWLYIAKNSIYLIILTYGLVLLLYLAKHIFKGILYFNPFLFRLTEPIPERKKVFNHVVSITAKNDVEHKMLSSFYHSYIFEDMEPCVLHILSNWEEFCEIYNSCEYLLDNEYYYSRAVLEILCENKESFRGDARSVMMRAYEQLYISGALNDVRDGLISLEKIKYLYLKFQENLKKDYNQNKPKWHWMEADLWLHEDYSAVSGYYRYFWRNTFLLSLGLIIIICILYFGTNYLFENLLANFILIVRNS